MIKAEKYLRKKYKHLEHYEKSKFGFFEVVSILEEYQKAEKSIIPDIVENKQYILTKEDVGTVYFKCQDRKGCTYTSSKEDAMKFGFYSKTIEFNYENLYGECEVVEY